MWHCVYWLPTFLRRVLASFSGALLSNNIALAMNIEAESSETSVAIYSWHGLISEINGISNVAYEPSHCTGFCSLCYLPPRLKASLFPVPHPYKTAGKTIVVLWHSGVSFSEWDARRGRELSCNMSESNFLKPAGSWCTSRFNIQKLYILPTPYLFCRPEQAATFALRNITDWFF